MPNPKEDIEKFIHKLDALNKCHKPTESNIDVALDVILGTSNWKTIQTKFDFRQFNGN